MPIRVVLAEDDVSGWSKAGWMIFAIVLPFLGVLVYLGNHGQGIAERNAAQTRAAQADLDKCVRDVAATAEGPTAEIASAKQLLDSGVITQGEFDAIQQKALA